MPARSVRRFRLLIWLDAAGNPTQAATAVYDDDERLTEHTWTPEPFDSVLDVANAAVRALDIQLTLWPTGT